jgi:hypothetical protein
MSLQDAAARRERGQRALRDAVGPDSGHEFVDDCVPYAPRHQGVRSMSARSGGSAWTTSSSLTNAICATSFHLT